MQNLREHSISSSYDCLEILHCDNEGVMVVLLNRPQKRNAINAQLWNELGSMFQKLPKIASPRAVVLAGSGKDFCAGIDLSDPALLLGESNGEGEDQDCVARVGLSQILPKLQKMQACFTAIEQCPIPVIAAVHGNCIGAGVDLIAAADIRWCARESLFSIREVAIGLTADVGVLQRLPKIAGGNDSLVRELCLTGRNFDANEAVTLGLISRIVSRDNLYQEALQLARQIARLSPVAVQGTKKTLLYARDHSVAEGLEQVAYLNALALQGSDLMTALQGYKSRAKPDFPDMPRHSKL